MPYDIVRGFENLNTSANPKNLADNQLAYALNTEYISDSEIYVRRGSEIRKSNSQWTGANVIDGATFKRREDETYAEIIFLDDGRIFYIENADYVDETSTYTEILSIDNTSPALATGLTKVSFDAINNKFFIVDGSSNIYMWDTTTAYLQLVRDPTDFTISMEVDDSVAATIGDIYEDYIDTSRTFLVKTSKVAGDLTFTLEVRQLTGNTRPDAVTTLDKVSGTGDTSIDISDIAYNFTYEEYKLYQRRGMAVTNEGVICVSTSRNGDNFTGAGSGSLEFDVIEGLKVSNFVPFKNAAVITTEDIVTEKFSISTLTGYKFFEATVAGSEQGQFKVERESKIHGIVGRSAQEIGNQVIGLTRNGFIGFNGTVSNQLGITDQDILSAPIKNQIKKINFSRADKIFSVIDTKNQRYLCAVPTYENTSADTIFVFDYGRSVNSQKWSIWRMGFGDISGLFNLKNDIYIADTFGNYHQLGVDRVFTDNGEGYTVRVETSAFGANTSVVNKNYKSIFIDFKIPDAEQEITLYTKLDGHIITQLPNGRDIKPIKLQPRYGSGNLINNINFIDDNTLIGSNAIGEQQIKHDRIGGKTQVGQIGIVSSTAGVNFGITGIMLEYEQFSKAGGQ